MLSSRVMRYRNPLVAEGKSVSPTTLKGNWLEFLCKNLTNWLNWLRIRRKMNFNFRHYYLDLFIDILFHLFIDVPFEFAKPWAEHLAKNKVIWKERAAKGL